ncbi:MAG TPA: methyltransferase domain-containing protein [Caldilineaceae bacterium]|nr:methyltransferase domain-containing protein [Caldilineaceae bacterium]
MRNDKYIPALSFRWLTPLYDPLLRWAMQEEQFKRDLVRQAALQPGHHVLDLGCGTGTLTLLLKQTQPAAHVTGLDGDSDVLRIAHRKARMAGVAVAWVQGLAYALPYPADVFDRVVTSLVLHHLTTESKQRALAEVARVLRPGGELHVADFGPPRSAYARTLAPLLRHFEEVADNLAGGLPALFSGAGFHQIEETARLVTVVGDLAVYRMAKQKPTANM